MGRGISVPTLMWGFCGILNIYSKQDPCIMSFLFNFLNNLEHSFGWNILKVIVFKCICFIHVLFLHIVIWRVICYSWRYDFLLFLRIASINFFYVFQKNSLGEFVHNYISALTRNSALWIYLQIIFLLSLFHVIVVFSTLSFIYSII